MSHPVRTYLAEMRDIRRSGAGVAEMSYYSVLRDLLDAVGKPLKPRVRCIISIQNQGAGLPDGGLFTRDQFARASADAPREGQLPSRGAIEVKGVGDEVDAVVGTQQVKDYVARYGQLLLTNYRDFLLLERDAEGRPVALERFRLAGDGPAFWQAADHPQVTAKAQGDRLVDYLRRVMLRPAPLAEPEDLAWYLASYAREARARVESRHDLPALAAMRAALEEALGLEFQGDKGEHFFRSTLVQTLFYGIFAAWVLWHREPPPTDRRERFEWRGAHWYLHVPMIRGLFQQLASPQQLAPLDLVEVLDWAGDALQRVDTASFFDRFDAGQAVQYFYEPFLRAFDPELRKELGVWYTPPEIVQYMVARVDSVLRSELGLADGLADPSVYVLDPCCGTGAYLVEVLKRICQTLQGRGGDALLGQDVKAAAMERVFGFELLPAPFVIAHLQLGLLLHNLGAPLCDERRERARVYLTNALTGWEPPQHPKEQIPFLDIEEERRAAEDVKQNRPVLVILGNPPYNAFAGVSPAEEGGLVDVYKEGLVSEWALRKFNLDELYVRFFRLAERRIAEKSGRGVVCYVSNHSWVREPSFVVLRKHLMQSFDRFWIENMHGDRKASEYAPDGHTSETVFAIRGFSVGIKQGVVISLWTKRGGPSSAPEVLFRDDLAAAKAEQRRADLVRSLDDPNAGQHYTRANPSAANWYSFRPEYVPERYGLWPGVDELWAQAFAGLAEDRRKSLIGPTREKIERTMCAYLDGSVEWEALPHFAPHLVRDLPRFPARKTRQAVLEAESYDQTRLLRYAMRPFDVQWCYYCPVRPLWREPRPEYWAQYEPGTSALVTRFNGPKSGGGPPVTYVRCLVDYHMLPPNASVAPFILGRPRDSDPAAKQQEMAVGNVAVSANLSHAARRYLSRLGSPCGDAGLGAADVIWLHVLAVCHSPLYLAENGDGICRDWPRIPLPNTSETLSASAELGARVARLLDTEEGVAGVTEGEPRTELRLIGIASRTDGQALQPDELAVTAGWGHANSRGAVQPGVGRSERRAFSAEEVVAIAAGAEALGLTAREARRQLGETTRDVYLNDVAYWRNVPERVWTYTIGGYQVMKKWLSYREADLLGRPLTLAEMRQVTNMARCLAAILLLEPELDRNYRRCAENAYQWPAAEGQ